MQIGELSARSGATVRMLRYYEEQGLLRPGRTGSGYRVFAESDIERVRYIRCLLASALPSPVVRQTLAFLDGERPSVPANVDVLQGQLDELDERITLMQRSRDHLALFVADVRGQLAGDVYLRDVREGDLDEFFRHEDDPDRWARLLADEGVDKRTVLAGGRIVGHVVAVEREVSYKIWGPEPATEALAEFLRQITTRPLYASTGSERVLKECGFTSIGEGWWRLS